jgi:hypothetical protein
MSQRAAALGLLRALLREAKRMPTGNRRRFVRDRALAGFRDARAEADPERLTFLMRLADTQLDNVRVQVGVLNELAASGNLKGPKS